MISPESLRHWTPPVAALLRGEVPDAVRGAGLEEATALADACVVHGVHGVLYHQFVGNPDLWHALPQVLRQRLEYQAKVDLAWELAHKAELRSALSALSKAGIAVLILKGTALAYSLYPVPSIRSRGDTDLLVQEKDVPALCDVLANLGYLRDTESQGIGSEVNLTKKDRADLEHVLDVHWRLSSNEVFAKICDWDEACRMSNALPALAPQARGLGYVHALLHACAHRAVHFHSPYYVKSEPFLDGNRLIWLYDMQLLAGAFEEADWSSFVARARERSVSAICSGALYAVADLVGTAVPNSVCAELDNPVRHETSAQLLSGGAWRATWVELRAQRDMSAQLKFLRNLFLPDRAYMLRKYAGKPSWLLPWLYLQRVLEGVHRRIRYYR
jgi:hypothetical protein